MGKIGKGRTFVVAVVVFGLIGVLIWSLSREKGVLVVEGTTEVLAKPFPPGHPYENSEGRNEVVKVLQAGDQIEFIDTKYDKDFATYQVEVDGKKGYIVSGGQFKVQQK